MKQLSLKELIQSQIQKALLENSESIEGKALPLITLKLIYHSSDSTIFRDPAGELVYFNSNALDDSEYEDYAKSGIGNDLTAVTGKWHLDKNTVENYVNTNLNTLSVGTGLIDYEKANTDLVKIDNDLRKELLKTSPFIKDRAQRAEYQKSLLEQTIKKQVLAILKENLEVSDSGLEDKDKELPEFSKKVEVFLQSFKDHRFLSKSLESKLRQYYKDENFEGAYNEIVAAFRPYYEKYESTLGYHWDSFHEWIQEIKDESLPFSSSGSFATALMDDDFFFGEAYERFNLESNEVEQLIK
tara:strand:- start:812 stop:1708 length:897 start_codon:yes stop_codon:yes gene_type:complete